MTNSLKSYLDAHGLSQKAFAERIGVRPATVSDWLNGKLTPRPSLMSKVAEATDNEVPVTSWFQPSQAAE